MLDLLYSILFSFALICFTILIFIYLARSIIGPTFFDRILGINNISTIIIMMCCIMAVIQGENYIVDIALIYALLGFVTIVIVSKGYLRSHKKEKSQDFSNLRKQPASRELPKEVTDND